MLSNSDVFTEKVTNALVNASTPQPSVHVPERKQDRSSTREWNEDGLSE
jgi:hypothetical protein